MKGKSDDEKKAVAGGIAFAVVVILFLGWAFFFLKKIQSGSQELQFGAAGEEFYSSSVLDAQQKLMRETTDTDDLRTARDQSDGQYQRGVFQDDFQGGEFDQFGGSSSVE